MCKQLFSNDIVNCKKSTIMKGKKKTNMTKYIYNKNFLANLTINTENLTINTENLIKS